MSEKLKKLSKILYKLELKKYSEDVNFLNKSSSAGISDLNFIVKNGSCSGGFLKLAELISKEATIYYGKAGSGIMIVCQEDNTVLLLERSKHVEQPLTWGIAGGAVNKGDDEEEGWYSSGDGDRPQYSDEEFKNSALREAKEELFYNSDFDLNSIKMNLVGETEYKDKGFIYKTFIYDVSKKDKEEITKNISLNWENNKARWYPLSTLPSRLHFGVQHSKDSLKNQGLDLFKDRVDELDWLREKILDLKKDVKPENVSILREIIGRVSSDIPTFSTKSGGDWADFYKEQRNKTVDFFNKAIVTLNAAGERSAAIKLMKDKSEFGQKQIGYELVEDRKIKEMKDSDFSAHSGFFYHGTPLINALSILKSGTFHASGAFTRLSLTSDLSKAGKFGDTVFVFDAKKLQRRGAKKMQYGDISTLSRLQKLNPKIDENYLENPWIGDVYKSEREWILKLPYTIEPGDLVKVIFFASPGLNSYQAEKKATPEEAIQSLNNLTSVPVEVVNYPSSGFNYPTQSPKPSISHVNKTDFAFSSLVSQQEVVSNLKEKYFNFAKSKLEHKDIEPEIFRRDPIYRIINSTLIEITEASSFLKRDVNLDDTIQYIDKIKRILDSSIYLLDADRLPSNYRDLEYCYKEDWFSESKPYRDNIKIILESISSKSDDAKMMRISEVFDPDNLNKDEKYIAVYFGSSSYRSNNILLAEAKKWCTDNIEKIISIPNLKEYVANAVLNSKDLKEKGVYFKLESEITSDDVDYRLNYLVQGANPNKVPDELFEENIFNILDNAYLENIPDSRLEKMYRTILSSGKVSYDGKPFDHNFIFESRYGYSSGAKKEKLKKMILTSDPNFSFNEQT